jgi:hypothetical protein
LGISRGGRWVTNGVDGEPTLSAKAKGKVRLIEISFEKSAFCDIPVNVAKPRVLTLFTALSLVVTTWVGSFSSGVPTLYCPLPTVIVFPALMLLSSGTRLAAMSMSILPAVLFFAWNHSLLTGQPTIPKRTVALIALLGALTIVYFKFLWFDGLQYQGHHHTLTIFLVNLIWLAVIGASIAWSIVRPSFYRNLLTHWLLFAWLGWYAFPYFGELP